MNKVESPRKYPPGFNWGNRKEIKKRDLTLCPACKSKLVICSNNDGWVNEYCQNCPLTRKRRKHDSSKL